MDYLKKLVVVVFIILISMSCSKKSNSWEKTFGGKQKDRGESVAETRDGGYIIAGRTSSFGSGNDDIYLVKADQSGNEIWVKTFGGKDDEWGFSVEQTMDGGYIIAGATSSYGEGYYDVYLIKTDELGNKQWSRTFGGEDDDFAFSVQQTRDGGYIIVGWTSSFGAGKDDVYLIKTNATGKEQWSKTFGGVDFDLGLSVKETTDGGYIIVGWTSSFGKGNGDVYLVKTDALGNKQWSKQLARGEFNSELPSQSNTEGG
jgi:hypothetical protein